MNDPTDDLYGQRVLSNQLEEAMQCLEAMARQLVKTPAFRKKGVGL